MPNYNALASQILENIKSEGAPLGDDYYADVWCVANGKLRDRSNKVYDIVGEKRVKEIVCYSTKALTNKLTVEKMEEMAKYYRHKYTDIAPEKVETLDG